MGDTEMRPGDAPGTKLAPEPGCFSAPLTQKSLVLGRRPSATTSSTEIIGERCCVCSAERPGLEKLDTGKVRAGLRVWVLLWQGSDFFCTSPVCCRQQSCPQRGTGPARKLSRLYLLWAEKEEKPKKNPASPLHLSRDPHTRLAAHDPAARPGLGACGCLHASSTASFSPAPSSPNRQQQHLPVRASLLPCLRTLPAPVQAAGLTHHQPPLCTTRPSKPPSSWRAWHRLPFSPWPPAAASSTNSVSGYRGPPRRCISGWHPSELPAARDLRNPSEPATVQQQLPLPPAVPLHPPPLCDLLHVATLPPLSSPHKPNLRCGGCQGTPGSHRAKRGGEGCAAGCPGELGCRAGRLQTSEETNFNYRGGAGGRAVLGGP